MPQAPPPLHAGRTLNERYRLVSLIAKGGMAEVWEGKDERLGRPIAIKVLHPHLAADRSFAERFRREAIAAARLAHPNIVATYDTAEDAGLAYIVMELVQGETLREALVRHNAFSPAHAVHIAAQVADALAYAHRAGIVHRDVKPANILLFPDGRVKVADFGIAKAAPSPLADNPSRAGEHDSHSLEPAGDLTKSGSLIGTAKYFSPEQSQGHPLDGRTDIYSLGVVLYEMLCGRPPFAGDTDVSVALQHVSATPVSPRQVRAGIPRPLEAVVLRALAKAPDDRFTTAEEMHSALLSIDMASDDALAMVVRDTTPPRGTPPTFVQSERSALVPAVLIVIVAVALGVLGVLFARSETGRRLLDESPLGDGEEQPVAIVEAISYDPPPGSGSEHDDEIALLLDDDPSTEWTTERYSSPRFGGLKSGVGVVVRPDRAQKLKKMEITTATRGWSAEVYLADAPRPTAADWGPPVARQLEVDSDSASFDLKNREGGAVLLWITDLGAGNQSVAIGGVKLVS